MRSPQGMVNHTVGQTYVVEYDIFERMKRMIRLNHTLALWSILRFPKHSTSRMPVFLRTLPWYIIVYDGCLRRLGPFGDVLERFACVVALWMVGPQP